MKNGNREYRSDVFCMLLEYPENALSLFNAMNGSEYKDPNLVEICTLEKSISLTVRNDASFIVDNILSLYEHQSTICPNMPLRFLFYVSDTYKRRIEDANIYGKSLVKIPTPKFVVFYNGDGELPEISKFKLSDSFEQKIFEPELELTCTVYNINQGNNGDILENCSILKEYMIFIDYVKYYALMYGNNRLEDAIIEAIDRCIKENVLTDFLSTRKTEVIKTMVLDYTYERQIELEKKSSREEGRQEGEALVYELLDKAKELLDQGYNTVPELVSCGIPEKVAKLIATK